MRKGFDNLFTYLNIPLDKQKVIIDVIKLFKESDQVILKKKCGNNYDGVDTQELSASEKTRLHSVIIPRLRSSYITLSTLEIDGFEYNKELKSLEDSFRRTKKGGSVANLLGYFHNLYSFEELDGVVKSLKEEESKAIYAVCGVLLNGEDTKEDTLAKGERTKVNTHYLPKVKSRLKKLYPERGSKDERVEEVTKGPLVPVRKIENGSDTLDGKVLDVTVKDDIGFTKEDYLDIVKIFSSEEFKELTRLQMPLEEIIVASLLHHGYNGKRFRIEDLEKFLGIGREDIVAIAKKSTETYRKAINDKINEYETHLLKLITTGNKGE